MIEQSTSNITNGIKLAVVDIPEMDIFKKKFLKRSEQENMKSDRKNLDETNNKTKSNNVQPPYLTMFVAETLGTALLLFLGCMGCIEKFDTPSPFHHFGSITFGLTVMTIIQTFGHISGAHLNPAVTIATVLFGFLTTKMAIVYIIAQFIGAIIGIGLLKVLAPEEYVGNGFCATTIHSKISVIQALGIEIVITTLLILVCCAVWDKRNSKNTDSVALRFGFVIAMISMAAGPLTGASMNTARSFAPLIFGGNWQDQWIYLVGPNIAVPIGCGIYKFFFSLPQDYEENDKKDEMVSLENDLQLTEKV